MPRYRYDRILVFSLPLVLLLGAGGAWWAWQAHEAALLRAAEAAAREQIDPVKRRMDEAAAAPYDVDTTIRVVHEIDRALADPKVSMRDYLAAAAAQDYAGVHPDVLTARGEILDVLFRLAALQTRAEEQEELWAVSAEYLLKTMSLVEVQATGGVPTGMDVDREQAQKLLEELREEKAEHRRVSDAIRKEEAALYDAVARYAQTLRPRIDEWDRLSTLRDRARLAAREQEWAAARIAADEALNQPNTGQEWEAHLLGAQARLEGGGPEDLDAAEGLVAEVLRRHPDHAPALLLRGVVSRKRGDLQRANLDFQQAAALYPKQAEALADVLDPYARRDYLEKTREGGWILESYRASLLGAGYWSPDLQLAKMRFERGQFDPGKRLVLDHFARRRAQGQWDYLYADIDFCEALLGEDFRSIFPEEAWLDLVVGKELVGRGITLAVKNRSGRTLRNATLVLAIQYTDMLPGQYVARAAERTLPAVLPLETTDFGSLDIDTPWQGKEKTRNDVVMHRAVLLSDDAVIWVDTDEFKLAEAKEFRERPPPARTPTMASKLDRLVDEAGRGATVTAATAIGADGVVFALPRGLSIVAPVFTLTYAGREIAATKNVIEGDQIVLEFPDLANFEAADASLGDLALTVSSVFGERTLRWSPAGGMTWRFAGVE